MQFIWNYSIGVWNPLRTPKTYTNTSKRNKKTSHNHIFGALRAPEMWLCCFFVDFTCVLCMFWGFGGGSRPLSNNATFGVFPPGVYIF